MVTSYGNEYAYEIKDSGKRIVICDERNKSSRILQNVFIMQKLRRIIRVEKTDVAISFMSESIFRIIVSFMFLPVITICSIRTDPAARYNPFINALISRVFFSRCDHLVFQIEDGKRFLSSKMQNNPVL